MQWQPVTLAMIFPADASWDDTVAIDLRTARW